MTRVVEDQLLDFCVGQWKRFDQSEWSDFTASFDDRAIVALYLSNTSWFGQRNRVFAYKDYLEVLDEGTEPI